MATPITKEKRVVRPNEPKSEEEEPLGPSSGWGREHLRMLGVKFPIKQKMDLNRVLQVKESEWPQELRERMISPVQCVLN